MFFRRFPLIWLFAGDFNSIWILKVDILEYRVFSWVLPLSLEHERIIRRSIRQSHRLVTFFIFLSHRWFLQESRWIFLHCNERLESIIKRLVLSRGSYSWGGTRHLMRVDSTWSILSNRPSYLPARERGSVVEFFEDESASKLLIVHDISCSRAGHLITDSTFIFFQVWGVRDSSQLILVGLNCMTILNLINLVPQISIFQRGVRVIHMCMLSFFVYIILLVDRIRFLFRTLTELLSSQTNWHLTARRQTRNLCHWAGHRGSNLWKDSLDHYIFVCVIQGPERLPVGLIGYWAVHATVYMLSVLHMSSLGPSLAVQIVGGRSLGS